MSAYMFICKPKERPERVLDANLWWSCSRTTRRRDRIFVYVTGTGLAYEWRATSDARPDKKWNYVCDVESVAEIAPPISIGALPEAIPEDAWSPPHQNLRGFRSLSVPSHVEVAITSLRGIARRDEKRDVAERGPVGTLAKKHASAQGQVFTVAKFHYVNGVVYFTASEGRTDIATLAKHSAETTKSGDVKHPEVRVRTIMRLAEGVGLVRRIGRSGVEITDLGKKYYQSRAKEKWSLSEQQQEILRERILSNPSATPTIHAIRSLLDLVQKGFVGKELAHRYAVAIRKEKAWQSDVTFEGFTTFGLSYLKEMGFLEHEIELQVEPAEEFERRERSAERQARRLSDEEIRSRAAKARSKPGQKRVLGIRYERDPYVAEHAKRRAKGVCELCGKKAPFEGKDGDPYLETHHIVWLSKGGFDREVNTVALCPNCHRRMHVLDSQDDKATLVVRAAAGSGMPKT